MYDSVDVLTLPAGADLYAGYDDGAWPDAPAIAARFPGARVLRVTTDPADNLGDVLDVERGDARPQDLPGWVKRRRSGLVSWPWGYCNASTWPAARQACIDARVAEPLWWVAAYPGPGPVLYPGAVAHQWASTAGFDVSVVAGWVPGLDPVSLQPRPLTTPLAPMTPEDPMPLLCAHPNSPEWFVVSSDLSGKQGIPTPADLAALQSTGLYRLADLSASLLDMIPVH